MTETRYVFDTEHTLRYRFPTHTNLLILDRAESAACEAFWVVLEPGEAPPTHLHEDAEQIFYVTEGMADLAIGLDSKHVERVGRGDLVRIPAGTYHAMRAVAGTRVVYLSIDCFLSGSSRTEPTWESHVRVMCRDNGWSIDDVRDPSAVSGQPGDASH